MLFRSDPVKSTLAALLLIVGGGMFWAHSAPAPEPTFCTLCVFHPTTQRLDLAPADFFDGRGSNPKVHLESVEADGSVRQGTYPLAASARVSYLDGVASYDLRLIPGALYPGTRITAVEFMISGPAGQHGTLEIPFDSLD